MTTPYTTGTVSVTAGSAVVTGLGTGWQAGGIVGGFLGLDRADGNPIPILSVDSDTQITLAKPWRGATAAGQGYWIVRDSAWLRQVADNSQKLATYLARLDYASLAALAALSGSMGADRIPYATGPGGMAWSGLSAFARTLLDDANAAAFYQTLGEIPNPQLPARLRSDPPSAGTDLNALTTSGFYQVGAGAANIPEGGQGTVIVGSVGNGATSQIFTRLSNGNVWTRTQQAGSWTDWRRLSADRGSNANGEYVRLGDGTQICTQTDVTLGYSSSTRLVYAWTFPATFPGGVMFADVMLPAGGSNFQNVSIQNCGSSWSSRSSVGGSQIGINNAGANNFASNTQVSGCSLIAVGRWF